MEARVQGIAVRVALGICVALGAGAGCSRHTRDEAQGANGPPLSAEDQQATRALTEEVALTRSALKKTAAQIEQRGLTEEQRLALLAEMERIERRLDEILEVTASGVPQGPTPGHDAHEDHDAHDGHDH